MKIIQISDDWVLTDTGQIFSWEVGYNGYGIWKEMELPKGCKVKKEKTKIVKKVPKKKTKYVNPNEWHEHPDYYGNH